MAGNKLIRLGPAALTNAAANVWNPPTLTGGVGVPGSATYVIIRHIRAVNKTGSQHTVTAYVGGTGGSAAGTEFAWNATVVPANSAIDWYGALRLDTADFLTGLADASTAVTIEAEGEIGVA